MKKKITFKHYDTEVEETYVLKSYEILLGFWCPFDGTSLVQARLFDDYYDGAMVTSCPNCKTGYDFFESQEQLDEQKDKILGGLRGKIRKSENEELRKLEGRLIELEKNPMTQD